MSDMRTLEELKQSFVEKSDYLTDLFGEPVKPYAFYRDLFPKGSLQERYKAGGHPEDGGLIGYVTVVRQERKKPYTKDYYLTDDLRSLVAHRDTVTYVSPCSYVGGGRSKLHLRRVHALVVDLDYVDLIQLEQVLYQAWGKYTPIPTYIVNSGTGLHLYYVFNEPIAVSQSTTKGLEALKNAYTGLVWNMHTSQNGEKQYEPLVQNYRVIGSRSKLDTEGAKDRKVIGNRFSVSAYKWGDKYTLKQLLWFEPNEKDFGLTGDWIPRIKEARRLLDKSDPEHLTLERAKALYPDWYEERIEKGIPKPEVAAWIVNPAVYEWWKGKVYKEAKVGARYHALRYLAAYALKCGIDKETLYKDAYALQPILDRKGQNEHERFTREDVDAALKSFYMPYMVCVTAEHIAEVSHIPITPNKRNHQKQTHHLEEARAIRDVRQARQGTNWWDNGNREGAPTKQQLILDYARIHPTANHSEIARALGVSRPTVIKWLKDRENRDS